MIAHTYHDVRHFAGARAQLQTRAQAAMGRGHAPAAEALWQVFQELVVDEPALRRMGALVAHADVRYPMPGAGHHALAGTFAPDLTLQTDRSITTGRKPGFVCSGCGPALGEHGSGERG